MIEAQEWVSRFARHITQELRDPIGAEDAHDWGWDVYPEYAGRRPEDVAQMVWTAATAGYEKELQEARDEKRAAEAQRTLPLG